MSDASSSPPRRTNGQRLKKWAPPLLVVGVGLSAWRMGWVPSLGGETVLPSGSWQSAPDFVLASAGGGPAITLASERGKVVLVNFWATWCPPCRMEVPGFVSLFDRYKDRGFTILGISLDGDGVAAVAPFVRDHGMAYPVALGDAGVVAAYGGIRAIPTSFLVDRQSRIIKKYVGLLPASRVERDIQGLLSRQEVVTNLGS